MSLVQDTSVAGGQDDTIGSATSTPSEARPDARKRIADISLTAIVLAGIATLTLGWGVLLVRGAIWLFLG
jgi:hypothetical protein